MRISAVLVILMTFILSPLYPAARLQLWHAYRGEEKRAVEEVARMYNITHPDTQVDLLAVPFDAFRDKLTLDFGAGRGPDVFIMSHDAAGFLCDNEWVLPLETFFRESDLNTLLPEARNAYRYAYPASLWGMPANAKCLTLFYNQDLVKNPPLKFGALIDSGRAFTNPRHGQFGRYGLVYETANFYYHALFVLGFGGRLFRDIGKAYRLPLIYTKPQAAAARFVRDRIIGSGICPRETSRPLVTQLFNTGNALYVINGQWFRGEVDKRIRYGVALLPFIEEAGAPGKPLTSVEGYYLSAQSRNQKAAVELIRFFTTASASRVFAKIAGHTPVRSEVFRYAEVANDPLVTVFVAQSKTALPTPVVREMDMHWGMGGTLDAIWQGADIESELKKRQNDTVKLAGDMHGKPALYKEYLNVKTYME